MPRQGALSLSWYRLMDRYPRVIYFASTALLQCLRSGGDSTGHSRMLTQATSPPSKRRTPVQNPQTARTNTTVVSVSVAFGLTYAHDVTARKQDCTNTPVFGLNGEIRHEPGTFMITYGRSHHMGRRQQHGDTECGNHAEADDHEQLDYLTSIHRPISGNRRRANAKGAP